MKVDGTLFSVASSVRMINDQVDCDDSSFACGCEDDDDDDAVELLFGMYDPSVKM